MLDEQGQVTGYRSSPVASEEAHGNLRQGADPNFDALVETVDDDENCDFDGVVDWKSAQCDCVKRRLQESQSEC